MSSGGSSAERDWPRLADAMRRRLDERGWTWRDLVDNAARQGHSIGPATVGKLQSGSYTKASDRKLIALAHGLRWTPESPMNVLKGGDPVEFDEQPQPEVSRTRNDWLEIRIVGIEDLLRAILSRSETMIRQNQELVDHVRRHS